MHLPSASTLRTQSAFGPYVRAMTYLPARRKTFMGVRYWRCVFRPVCTTTAKPGRRVASRPVRRFVTRLLKRATEWGRGMRNLLQGRSTQSIGHRSRKGKDPSYSCAHALNFSVFQYGQREIEGRTLFPSLHRLVLIRRTPLRRCALHPHASTVHFDPLLDDSKAKPRAPGAARPRAVCAVKS